MGEAMSSGAGMTTELMDGSSQSATTKRKRREERGDELWTRIVSVGVLTVQILFATGPVASGEPFSLLSCESTINTINAQSPPDSQSDASPSTPLSLVVAERSGVAVRLRELA